MNEGHETAQKSAIEKAPYMRFLGASMHHALVTTLRRKRTILAVVIALLPVVIPLLLTVFTEGAFGQEGNKLFVMLVEDIYVKALLPLLANGKVNKLALRDEINEMLKK